MNETFTEIFDALKNDLFWINTKWQVFVQFYGTDKNDLELINEMSPNLFRILQDTLVDDLILGLSRLTDPASTRRGKETRDNLTFTRLLQAFDAATYPELATKLQTILSDLTTNCQAMREQRNKRIAHSDLTAKLKASTEQILPPVNRKMLESALKLASDFLNTISIELEDKQIAFDLVILHDDGRTLLTHLRMARAYHKHLDGGRVDPWEDGVFTTP